MVHSVLKAVLTMYILRVEVKYFFCFISFCVFFLFNGFYENLWGLLLANWPKTGNSTSGLVAYEDRSVKK